MGVAVGDYDLDGNLDIFKTHFSDDTQRPLPQRRQGQLRRRHHPRGHWRRDALRRLGRRDGRPRQRRLPRPVPGDRAASTRRWRRTLPAYPFRTPRLVFRNLGNGRFEELIEEAGPGVAAAALRAGAAPSGTSTTTATWTSWSMNMNEPPSLLRNDVSGDGHWLKVLLVGVEVEPQRDRRARDRPLRRPDAGAGSDGAVELLLRQRSPPALRAGRRDARGPRRSAGRTAPRRRSERRSRSARRRSRGSGDCPPAEVRPLARAGWRSVYSRLETARRGARSARSGAPKARFRSGGYRPRVGQTGSSQPAR